MTNDVWKELLRILLLFYGNSSDKLKLIGVTGTDGKTTITTLCSFLLNQYKSAGYIGTNGFHMPHCEEKTIFTTPILSEVYRLLNISVQNSIEYVAIEASSEGLLNKRLETIEFDYCVFSNLTHEHLNTHKNMYNYLKSKLLLFSKLKANGIAIINKDDPKYNCFEFVKNKVYYSIKNPSDFQAINIRYFENETSFDIITRDKLYLNFKINRTEEYNLYNILPCIYICLNEKMPLDQLYKSLTHLPVVSGRLEKIAAKKPFDIYIDFAHTPNALKCVLSSLRRKTRNRLIIVCGAAGNKDSSKRSEMGLICSQYSDFQIFTSEDPRNENPSAIIDQITKKIKDTNFLKIVSRKEAIKKALAIAKSGDVVLITGKGRENFFEEKNILYEYSDFNFIDNLLKNEES